MRNHYVITDSYRVGRSIDFINSFDEDIYYMFVGDFANTASVPTPNNTLSAYHFNVFNEMIMGKKITPANISLGIRNIPYEGNTVYTAYDDTIDLSEKSYYAIVNATSYSHIFKCLDNNGNSLSTVEPNFSHIVGANTIIYQTSDMYIWKYMYTVDNNDISNFATDSFFPLTANATVTANAIIGSINVIKVEESGKRYDNYVFGTLRSSDIRVAPDVYQISNSSIKDTRSFYTGCIMLLTEGDGSGQHQTVVDSYTNATGNYVVLETDFPISPSNGTKFEISPECVVYDNTGSANLAVARAIINATSSNGVASIEILYPGSDMFYVTANVIANAAVGIIPSNHSRVRPILPPPGGHGANAAVELGASQAIMSLSLIYSESNTILTTNHFGKIGIIKSPIFANVELTLSGAIQSFDANETAIVTSLTLVETNVNVTSTTNTIVGLATAEFQQSFDVGDTICISNGTFYQIANVGTITNNLNMTITSLSVFDANNANIYSLAIKDTVRVINVASINSIFVSNSTGTIMDSDQVIGHTSGARANVEQIDRNDVTKEFNTFIQLYKYTISPVHGTFLPGETVYQGNNTAIVHSVLNNNTLYIDAPSARFTTTGPHILGVTSGAEATISKVYEPELQIGSGAVQYYDNIDQVTRQPTQTEHFKIVFDF